MISQSLAITLHCNFKPHLSYWGSNYACIAENLTTTELNRTVTAINGTHLKGQSNDYVTMVMIQHQNCPVLPINLGEHFKNLKVLYVMKSHVESLTNKDLEGLTKLKIFDVSYNPIRKLHKDYFTGHESIEIVSFYDCSLNFIEKGALEALTNLKEGHFQYNECVDFRGDHKMLIPSLIEELEKHCDPARFSEEQNTPPSRDHASSEYDNYDYEFYTQPSRSSEPSYYDHAFLFPSTEQPKVEIRYRTEYICELSFIREHAKLIIIFLVMIIIGLSGFIYKSNSFVRMN